MGVPVAMKGWGSGQFCVGQNQSDRELLAVTKALSIADASDF